MNLLRTGLIVLAILCVAGIVHANLSGSPAGNTGAPGEETCATTGCHEGATPDSVESIYVQRLTHADEDTLDMRVWVCGLGWDADRRHGFQFTVLDSLLQPVGELIVTDSANTQLVVGADSRQYITHTAAGTQRPLVCNFTPCCVSWDFRWVAPPGASLTATYYVAGCVGDGDLSAANDHVRAWSFVDPCPIRVEADSNNDGQWNAADVLTLVNWIFKQIATPTPCDAAGDINCDGVPTAADIITSIKYIKLIAPPCHQCQSPLASECLR